jgi:hypothetical protein
MPVPGAVPAASPRGTDIAGVPAPLPARFLARPAGFAGSRRGEAGAQPSRAAASVARRRQDAPQVQPGRGMTLVTWTVAVSGP